MSWIHRQILLTIGLLLGTLILFEITPLDFWVQDLLFNFDSHTWLWDRKEPIAKLILYDGIKAVYLLTAVSLALFVLLFRKRAKLQHLRQGLVIVSLSLILVPAFMSFAKDITNIPCPRDIVHYGGNYPHVTFFSGYPEDFGVERNVACFPAGHASGAFALMSLYFLCSARKRRYTVMSAVLILGWTIGGYKIVIGDHFLSHTVASMQISWLLILCLVQLVWPAFNPREVRLVQP